MKENTSSAHDQFLFGKSLGLKVSKGKSEITIQRKEGTKEGEMFGFFMVIESTAFSNKALLWTECVLPRVT